MKFHVLLSVLLIFLIAALTPAAHAEIYKCKDEHGNDAYLQTPCPVEKPEETPAAHDTDAEIAEPAQDEEVTESSPEPSSRRPSEQLNDCKKRYRDQIDEIDAEMLTAFSPEQGVAYKEKLLALTKQLRACE
jgi:hypothetical protein